MKQPGLRWSPGFWSRIKFAEVPLILCAIPIAFAFQLQTCLFVFPLKEL